MSVLPIFVLAVAGLLVGGVVSLIQQRASRFTIGVVAALALLAAAAGVAWLIPGGGS